MYSLGERQSIVKSDVVSGSELAGLILVCIRSRCELVVVKSKVATILLVFFINDISTKKKTAHSSQT